MTNYTPRHVSKDAVEALDEKIRQMEEKKRIEEKHKAQEKAVPLVIPEEQASEENRSRKLPYLLTGLLIFALILFAGLKISATVSAGEDPPKEEPVEEITSNPMDPELRSMWLSNRAINEDYVGQIVFDSGLIDLPFVQAKGTIKEDGEPYRFFATDGTLVEDPYAYNGNDVYIWTSWKTGEYDRYGEGGSVFMDYRNYLKDQNIIL
ncbi:MAG: hypothetical protein IIZ64_08935, partial [Erysipelotrichaceae bacterium]|nr:hypothetical protein [Erysipelotrichaceae bacterium]